MAVRVDPRMLEAIVYAPQKKITYPIPSWAQGAYGSNPTKYTPYPRRPAPQAFLGEKHAMMFGPTVFGTTPGQVGPRTIPEFAELEHKKPVKKIAPVKDTEWTKGSRHVQEWISACKASKQPCASFEHSAPLTEMVLLGNVALRGGKPIDWDGQKMQITNAPEADRLLRSEYRKGWSL